LKKIFLALNSGSLPDWLRQQAGRDSWWGYKVFAAF
jgi:hypothetical protein